MKQPNDFLMFLKNKHYYSLFRRNFSSRKIRNMFSDKNFIAKLYDNDPWDNSSLLGCAFSWGMSKEGYDFWSMVNSEMNKEKKKGERKMWVARDKDGDLGLFSHKPHRCTDVGWNNESWDVVSTDEFTDYMALNPNMFHDLTWEDEPIEVELVIKR